jgi:hypothetical protein
MALLYGRAGRLDTKNAGFRPGQWAAADGSKWVFGGHGVAATARLPVFGRGYSVIILFNLLFIRLFYINENEEGIMTEYPRLPSTGLPLGRLAPRGGSWGVGARHS